MCHGKLSLCVYFGHKLRKHSRSWISSSKKTVRPIKRSDIKTKGDSVVEFSNITTKRATVDIIANKKGCRRGLRRESTFTKKREGGCSNQGCLDGRFIRDYRNEEHALDDGQFLHHFVPFRSTFVSKPMIITVVVRRFRQANGFQYALGSRFASLKFSN